MKYLLPVALAGALATNSQAMNLFDLQNKIYKNIPCKMNMEKIVEDNKYVYKFEVPGVEKENISINIENNYLIVKIKRENKKEAGKYSEFEYGETSRTIQIDNYHDTQKINASLKNGILYIEIEKTEGSNNNIQIEIK